MAKKKQPDDDRLPAEDAERARDEALRRMLKTPPTPHKAPVKRPPESKN